MFRENKTFVREFIKIQNSKWKYYLFADNNVELMIIKDCNK